METIQLPNFPKKISRIGLGTWAIEGSLWGGTSEVEAINILHRAFDLGVNLIDTAPVYGYGITEEIVGKALKAYTGQKEIYIATKAGLDWRSGHVFRDSRKERIFVEIEASLKRLNRESIDLYQIHWPDFETPFYETAEAMLHLMEEGKIRAIGVSNYTAEMMQAFQEATPVHTLQTAYNLFERDIDALERPFCKENGIAIIGYGILCRGLLTGRMHKNISFNQGDIRTIDPKFVEPNFSHYLTCVEKLKQWVAEKYQRSIIELALRWVLDQNIDISLWGVRKPEQLDLLEKIWTWKLTDQDFIEMDHLIYSSLTDPLPWRSSPPLQRSEVIIEKGSTKNIF